MREARRAGDLLFVAGAFELHPAATKDGPAPDPQEAALLTEVYNILDYDLGYLSPEDRQFLDQGAAAAPGDWLCPDSTSTRVLKTKTGIRIGLVFFPPLQKGTKKPDRELVRAVDLAVAKMRAETDLVLALSPWGLIPEQSYLDGNDKGPDILLGSGPGTGLKGYVQPGGNTLWVRAYSKGQALNQLEVSGLPAGTKGFAWRPEKNIAARIIGLTENIQNDKRMARLLDSWRGESDAKGGRHATARRVYRIGDPFQERGR
ncbi:MAG: hypothetical protein PHV85_11850 [Desulfovibrionaceae bacterium]|nr:hypothetical protein [Desulfovibrionaceae bacterium]